MESAGRARARPTALESGVEPGREGPPGKAGAMETEGGVAEPAGQEGSH